MAYNAFVTSRKRAPLPADRQAGRNKGPPHFLLAHAGILRDAQNDDVSSPVDDGSMVLVIDNYDSFTYNLVQYLGELGAKVKVRRNDQITLEEIERMAPQRIVISPGPKTPNEAGICLEAIRKFAGRIPILGVCLGHQAIGQAFGGEVVRAPEVMHGKTSPVAHDSKTIFSGLPNPFLATRYHSLIVRRKSLPACLEISATSPDGLIMGLRHKQLPIEGVQFHPESVLTSAGKKLLENFLRL